MRSSHQLCSSVPSIPLSSTAITERPSHSSSAGPSRKTTRADLLPPQKRIRSSDSATDLEDCSDKSSESYVPRETSLRDDVIVRELRGFHDETYSEPDIDLEIQAEIDGVMHPAVSDDIPEPTQEGAVEVTYEALRDLVQRFHDHTVEIPIHRVQLERDNTRLIGTLDVASQRVSRPKRRELRVQIMPNTRFGATMTREAVDELIARRVAEALEARE
ncbi:hypothetical protein Tco_1083768 [Tanacetum coccineum]